MLATGQRENPWPLELPSTPSNCIDRVTSNRAVEKLAGRARGQGGENSKQTAVSGFNGAKFRTGFGLQKKDTETVLFPPPPWDSFFTLQGSCFRQHSVERTTVRAQALT